MELVLLLAISLILIGHGVEGGRNVISREEDLEFERQLKILNKPAIKSIQTEHGDIYDCVDIYKQPAFDHPLLKNHTIQMRPSSFPEWLTHESSSDDKDLKIGLPDGGCPQGTVPIRRIRKEDLIRAKSFLKGHNMKKSFLKGHNKSISEITDFPPGYGVAATSTTDGTYYGARGYINIYTPRVSDDQYSEATIWLSNGTPDQLNYIQAGWAVNPQIYGDKRTRITTYWTTDNSKLTGCIDTSCPGFVQTSSMMPLGMPIYPLSTYQGDQYIFKVSIFQDQDYGNWWLVTGKSNNVMGYWPKSLFNSLSGFASQIVWGGDTYGPIDEVMKPEMGSGHFPNEGYRGAAFFQQIQVIKSEEFEDPDESTMEIILDETNCYNITGKTDRLADPGYHFFFGGPGGACGN